MKRNSLPRAIDARRGGRRLLALGLSACGASNEDNSAGGSSSDGALRHAQRRRLLRPGGRDGAWKAAFQTANPDVTVNYDPSGSSAGREQLISGGVQFAGSDAYLTDDELTQAAEDLRRTGHRVPGLRQPDRGHLQPPRCRQAPALARDDRRDLRRQDHQVGRPGDHGRQPRRRPAAARHHAGPPFRRLGHDRQLHRLHEPDRSRATGPTAWSTSGRSRAVRAPRAPRASSPPSQHGEGTIGYADASQAGDLGVAAIKVGSALRRAERRGRLEGARRVQARSRAATRRPTSRSRSTGPRRPAGVYPIILVSYQMVCSTYNDQPTGRPGQGVRDVRHQRGRSGRGRARPPARPRSRTRCARRRRPRSTRSRPVVIRPGERQPPLAPHRDSLHAPPTNSR